MPSTVCFGDGLEGRYGSKLISGDYLVYFDWFGCQAWTPGLYTSRVCGLPLSYTPKLSQQFMLLECVVHRGKFLDDTCSPHPTHTPNQ